MSHWPICCETEKRAKSWSSGKAFKLTEAKLAGDKKGFNSTQIRFSKLVLTNSPDKRPQRPVRKPVSLLASVTHGGTTFDSVVFNLSRQGCNIIIDGELSDLTVGDTVGLDFAAYGRVGAILRWVQPQEAGLEFVVEDPELQPFTAWVVSQLQVDSLLADLPPSPND